MSLQVIKEMDPKLRLRHTNTEKGPIRNKIKKGPIRNKEGKTPLTVLLNLKTPKP
jgi:hypothetical protein